MERPVKVHGQYKHIRSGETASICGKYDGIVTDSPEWCCITCEACRKIMLKLGYEP